MSNLTIWIILGFLHVMLTTLFIIKCDDWFDITDCVIYIVAPITSVMVISVTTLALVILFQAPHVLIAFSIFMGLPIGIAWLIKKVRKGCE